MKFITTILLIGIGFFSYGQSDSAMIKFQRSLPIEDITETLSECNCMIMGMRGELNEKEEKLASRGQALIFGREYNDLDSLYKNGNDIIQLYAFGGICMTYPDSLKERHLKILNKEGEINIYQQGTDEFPKMPISKVAGKMYKVVAKNKKEKEAQVQAERKIKEFISEYCMFPESYEPINFSDYHVYSTHNGSSLSKIENSEIPSVKHTFKIKNKEGELAEYSARFKLDNELNIMLIEGEESGTVSCSPPRLDWWFERFGRELTDIDKTKLGLNK
jgi:hypothetical protein